MLFLPTPSARRATGGFSYFNSNSRNFYPRPPRGGRPPTKAQPAPFLRFLPTPSARRATRMRWMEVLRSFYFYPRPPRGGRPGYAFFLAEQQNFYPRPPRGGRPIQGRLLSAHFNFYPRPPRGGRRFSFGRGIPLPKFLPTPSARRATLAAITERVAAIISTHALREEGDLCPRPAWRPGRGYFYPRPPRGGRRLSSL